jgi:hypothetical protein
MELRIYCFVRQLCMVKNGRFLNTDLHHLRRNMNYKLDKEYIVKRFRSEPTGLHLETSFE